MKRNLLINKEIYLFTDGSVVGTVGGYGTHTVSNTNYIKSVKKVQRDRTNRTMGVRKQQTAKWDKKEHNTFFLVDLYQKIIFLSIHYFN